MTKLLKLPALALLALMLSPAIHAAGLLRVNGNGDTLQITQHQVSVNIENGFAITNVEQVFHNSSQLQREAHYQFPVPENATVTDFTVWIDNKPVNAEVVSKDDGQKIYRQEKQAGRKTGLASKNSHYNFDVLVSPIRPNADTKTRIQYIQALKLDSGIGRYVYPLQEGNVGEQNHFWQNSAVTEQFSFQANIRSSHPIKDVRLPKHADAVFRQHPDHWSVSLNRGRFSEGQQTAKAASKLDRDIVLYWRLQQDMPASMEMVHYQTSDSNLGSFMLTLTPADLDRIDGGRDWLFVIDTSGSMQIKLISLLEGMQRALQKMNSNDRFHIVAFDEDAREVTPGYVNATPEAIEQYSQVLDKLNAAGGTNVYAGLQLGLQSFNPDRSTGVILVTDGEITAGTKQRSAFINLLSRYDIRLFTFMMGNSSNRPLLQSLANASGGFAISISNSDDIVGQILLAADKFTHHPLTNIQVQIDGEPIYDVLPQRIPNLYRGQQLSLLGHYAGKGKAHVVISGTSHGQYVSYEGDFDFSENDPRFPELERLWAFAMVKELSDQLEEMKDPERASNYTNDNDKRYLESELTNIALKYGLVTDYTSMVLVQDEAKSIYQISDQNTQRVRRETQARQKRYSKPKQNVAQPQQPQQQPQQVQYSRPYASFSGGSSGGGATGIYSLLLIGFIVLLNFRRKINY